MVYNRLKHSSKEADAFNAGFAYAKELDAKKRKEQRTTRKEPKPAKSMGFFDRLAQAGRNVNNQPNPFNFGGASQNPFNVGPGSQQRGKGRRQAPSQNPFQF